MTLQVVPLLARTDNYIYMIHDPESATTIAIDPTEAEPVFEYLQWYERKLDYILNTHHHDDHVGGNLELKKQTGCRILCSSYDQNRIPGVDQGLNDNEVITLGSLKIHCLSIPGHTLGHMAYWIPEKQLLFPGDTLFSLGCGRLFEGSPEQMWSSLLRLRSLPAETNIYFGHEYTEANARFALSLDSGNKDLDEYLTEVKKLRAYTLPTAPTTLKIEKLTNLFLRADQDEIKAKLKMSGNSASEVFAELRKRKDSF